MKTDVIIIGGGPAGLSAGIFACRAGLNVLLIEELCLGGKVALTPIVENYPGFKKSTGFDLVQKMTTQAESLGLKVEYGTVRALSKKGATFTVETAEKKYSAKKVIIACGSAPRHLNLENEEKFTGKGISYCASCDGGFFKNKSVAVVGGGNTAIEDVDYLSRLAKKIYLINRRDIFRAGEHELNRIKKYKNLEVISSAIVTKLIGKESLEKIEIKVRDDFRQLEVDGLFVAIGHNPNLQFLKLDVKKDESGYLIVDNNMQTSVKNLYACGDIISKHFKQIVTACSDGAIAGNSCIGGK